MSRRDLPWIADQEERIAPVAVDDAAETERQHALSQAEAKTAARRHYHYKPEHMDYRPEGFERVPGVEVAVNPSTGVLVVFGEPLDMDEPPADSDRWHSCDEMGCGSLGPHALIVASVTRPHDFRGPADLEELGQAGHDSSPCCDGHHLIPGSPDDRGAVDATCTGCGDAYPWRLADGDLF